VGHDASSTIAMQVRKLVAAETPSEESQVRRSTCNHNAGYKATPAGNPSTVLVASTPEILQIEEMQRLGIEDCLIDPEELSVARLTQGRPDQ
jgi:hypothetical protein